MRILILDTYYSAFQQCAMENGLVHPGARFADQRSQWLDLAFGTADFYSRNLRLLGHEAEEIIVNCVSLQRAWATEYAKLLALQYPVYRALRRTREWLHLVLAEQVRRLRPDVLYVQDLNWIYASFLREMRPYTRLVVGQTSCALDPGLDLSVYDLLLSSFPYYVERFREAGLRSEYFRIAFEPATIEKLGAPELRYGAVFVGGYSPSVYQAGTPLLEEVAERIPVDFWGYGVERLAPDSPVRRRYHGEAWGLDMYRILQQSAIVVNRHGEVSRNYANNMRLFEATGVGTFLLTDAKDNLGELFDVGTEVVTYSSADECVEMARYYLEHETERSAIAAAGQRRTLRDHTYFQRMEELGQFVERSLQGHKLAGAQR